MAGGDQSSLQERFAPQGICFGCGPANPKGLRIRSFPDAGDPDRLLCEWTPEAHHAAFEEILNGGIIGALFDCHSNWNAAWHLMRRDALASPPCTVTADFHVKLKQPTPLGAAVVLASRVTSSKGPKAVVEATLAAGGTVTASCRGTFVAVKPDHPAYHRW